MSKKDKALKSHFSLCFSSLPCYDWLCGMQELIPFGINDVIFVTIFKYKIAQNSNLNKHGWDLKALAGQKRAKISILLLLKTLNIVHKSYGLLYLFHRIFYWMEKSSSFCVICDVITKVFHFTWAVFFIKIACLYIFVLTSGTFKGTT